MGTNIYKKPKIPCSVEILTRNSEKTLARCLESVKDFAEILILDGNSTDRTLEIAKRYGAKIYKQHDTDVSLVTIADFSEVRNKGLKLATYDWFMFIDSDEYLSKEAVDEIQGIVANPQPPVRAFWQPRKYVLNGKVIDCATTYPNKQVRLFQRSAVDGFIKPVHEKIKVKAGVLVGTLKNFEYIPVGDLKELKERWERYMRRELEMVKGASASKNLRLVFRHVGLFFFYALRYLRNFLICRGAKMPLRHEFARHSYALRTAGILIGRLFHLKF